MQDFQPFLAPAKINLFLHIVGQRADGYHLLQTVFRLLDYYDTIYLKPTDNREIKRANDIPGVPEDQDLCIRAARLLQQHTGSTRGVEIMVEKNIPMGGGLGGGSSDAATVLLALNRLWQLNLSRKELFDLGLKLGADVPFFYLRNKCLGRRHRRAAAAY
jgi:4-diphosphocytidyl-2-C-methyl-D-erythritol kinase